MNPTDFTLVPSPQHFFHSISTLVSNFKTQSMSTVNTSASKAEKAIWNDEETTVLVNYLVEHKAEAGSAAKVQSEPELTRV